MTQVRLRPLAESDLVEQTRYYASEGGKELGERFFDAAIATLDTVGNRPEGGSLRVGELCEIEPLRVRQVEGFPCGWLSFIRDDHVDVVSARRVSPEPVLLLVGVPLSLVGIGLGVWINQSRPRPVRQCR